MVDLVAAFYRLGHDVTQFLFVHIFQSDLRLFIGFVLVLQWHLRIALQAESWMKPVQAVLGAPRRNLRRFGLDVIVLQLFYDPDMPDFVKKRRFVASMLFILFENVALFELSKWLAEKLGSTKESESKGEDNTESNEEGYQELEDADDGRRRLSEVLGYSTPFQLMINMTEAENLDDPRWDKDDDPDNDGKAGDGTENLYMDLTTPISGVTPVFFIQIFLMMFYCSDMNDPDSDTKKPNKVEFGYWIVGVLVQLYAGEQQLGKPYNSKYWMSLLKLQNPDTGEECENTAAVASQEAKFYDCIRGLTYKHEWQLRSWMDYLVNSVIRDFIMFTFPIMLAVEEPMDFVKDCTAIFFLTTLDDFPFEKQKQRAQMLTRLKFNMCYERLKQHGFAADPIIPLPFTVEEAASVVYNPMEWDQFETQREYVSPYFLNPRKLTGKAVAHRDREGPDEFDRWKGKPLLTFMQEQTDKYEEYTKEQEEEEKYKIRAAFD